VLQLTWTEPDEEGLTDFLVNKMGFNADRVARGIQRIKDARKLTSQRRVDSFFTVLPSSGPPKRKADPKKGTAATNKKAKGAPKRR
jgi:flap endonuclease-1